MCGCREDALCEICLDARFMQLKGVAAVRGERWADETAQWMSRDREWPEYSPKMLVIARLKIAELGRDPKLLEKLAMECARWAAKRWNAARSVAANAEQR